MQVPHRGRIERVPSFANTEEASALIASEELRVREMYGSAVDDPSSFSDDADGTGPTVDGSSVCSLRVRWTAKMSLLLHSVSSRSHLRL